MLKIEEIERQAQSCDRCALSRSRQKVVFGSGNPSAEILFIGEAPGYNEDVQGIPFCGRAGQVLDRLLQSVSLSRKDVYITNIIKCRPPKNRDPEISEVESCKDYLDRQLQIIAPSVICCLGRHALKYMLDRFFDDGRQGSISSLHGQVLDVHTGDIFVRRKLVALYHPAVAVYNPERFGMLEQDFRVLADL